tara:strand:- start:574 stop:1050 length:477 start_codon:yes stop_codon:yes gene_type:complete
MKFKLIFTAAFLFSTIIFSQTVIKTNSNKRTNKKIIVKNNDNSKKIIIKDEHSNYHTSNNVNHQSNHYHNNIIVKSNRDRLIINRPNRPKKFKKRYKKYRHGFLWIGGFWKWSPVFGKYLWNEGHWIKKRRNHHWHDGFWEETPRGYYWVEGFWCNQY